MPRMKTKYKQMHFEPDFVSNNHWICRDQRASYIIGSIYKHTEFNNQYIFDSMAGRILDIQCCRDIQLFLAQLNKKGTKKVK